MKISKHQAVIVSSIVTVVMGGFLAYGVSAIQGPTEVVPEVGGPAEVTVEAEPGTVEPGVVIETQPEVSSEPVQTPQPNVNTPAPNVNSTETVPTPVETTPPVVETTPEPEFVPQPWMGSMNTSSQAPATEFPHKSN